jgi:hypothetical protein
MRAKNDPWYAKYLLHIGGGSEEANSDGEIRLPHDICIPCHEGGSHFMTRYLSSVLQSCYILIFMSLGTDVFYTSEFQVIIEKVRKK